MVSVIIPAYNAAKTIERTLNSVLAQTYTNIEVVIVNDGSKDDTELICKNIASRDKRVNVYSQKNKGVSEARNMGLSKASGTYIAWVDADDTIEAAYIEELVSGMMKAKADMIVSGYTLEFSNHSIRSKHIDYMQPHIRMEAKDCIPRLIEDGYIHPLWNKLFVRAKIKKGFDTNRSIGEDLDFVLNYLTNDSTISYAPCYGYKQFKDERETLTTDMYKSLRCANWNYDSIMQYMKINQLDQKLLSDYFVGYFWGIVQGALLQRKMKPEERENFIALQNNIKQLKPTTLKRRIIKGILLLPEMLQGTIYKYL